MRKKNTWRDSVKKNAFFKRSNPNPQVTCGECYPCRHGMDHICDNLKVMGFQTGGAAQEYFPVKANMVLKMPDSISLDHAAMIEPLAVAVHALARADSVQSRKVWVLGAGTIGNLVAQTCPRIGRGNSELITHRFPCDAYLDAYHAIDASQGKYLKVMIELD